MTRSESDLPAQFYQLIEDIPVKKWWRFIRVLGLPENEIDDIMYEGTILNEQKYQMLSSWKNRYGYNKQDSEVRECLELARKETLQKASPIALNRKLESHGNLLENRLTARAFYQAFDRIPHEKRNMFACLKLKIEDEISIIEADYPKDKEEQFYQLLLCWKRGNNMSRYQETSEALGKYLDEFLITSRTRGQPTVCQVNSNANPTSSPIVRQVENDANPASSFSYPEAGLP